MNFILVTVFLISAVWAVPDGYQYDSPHGEPLVQKHIYVHVPPPDPEFHAPPQRLIPAPPPKKHYKIVFIKAPTYAPPQAPVIPELEQHQEKTLIYVLHKNPSDAPPIVIPTAKPTQPSKPEVFFIRYKTQKEIGYANNHEDNGYLPSTAGYVSSTSAPHYVSSTSRPYIRSSRTPTPKYQHKDSSALSSDEHNYSPSTPSYAPSTVASKYIHTIRPYVRPVRTPMPKLITPKTPIIQEQEDSEENSESNESEE